MNEPLEASDDCMPGTLVVVNPRAGSGSAERRFESVRKRLRLVLGPARIEFTDCEGHAVRLARKAVQDGFKRVISVGGDGTHREVVNGILAADGVVPDDLVVGLLPLGSGNDLMRSMGIPGDIEQALPHVGPGTATSRVDVARCTCRSAMGDTTRYFVNVADVGLGGPCVAHAERYKGLGGTLAYLAGAVHSFVATDAERLRVVVDGNDLGTFSSRGIVVANGRYFGGGMHVAPQADLQDGLLDVIILGDLSALQFLYNLPSLYRGTYHGHDKVTVLRGRRIEVSSPDDRPVPVQIDGELDGHLPAVFELTDHRLTFSGTVD